MTLLYHKGGRNKKEKRSTPASQYPSHYHMFAKKSPAKEIPLLGKDKDEFSLPLFLFLLENSALPDLYVWL